MRILGVAGIVLRQHAIFFALCLVYFVAGNAYLDSLSEISIGRIPNFSYYIGRMFLLVLVVLGGMFIVKEAIFTRPEKLLKHCASALFEKFITTERLIGFAIIYLLMPLVFSTYSNIKINIPAFNPFSWDEIFAQWDQVVHFGRQPWEWLQPLLGTPIVTLWIHLFYIVWLAALYFVLFWQAFSTRLPIVRMQFFISFVLMWSILGSICAVLFSSAGPVYFDRVTGSVGPYGPLLEYLESVFEAYGTIHGTSLIEVQETLWAKYEAGEAVTLGGISAMPSMHIATVTLMTLVAWAHGRWLGLVVTAFSLVILVGSVHLAWHYAIDGYASIIGTVVLWYAVGRFLRRFAEPLGFLESIEKNEPTASK